MTGLERPEGTELATFNKHVSAPADSTPGSPTSSTHGSDEERLEASERHSVDDQGDISKWSLLAFYTSHALFMTNNRSYETASILFTASAFPDTLVTASIRGLSVHLASVLLSPLIGQWCSQQTSSLRPVQLSIIAQRVSIALACLGWTLILQRQFSDTPTHTSREFGSILTGLTGKIVFAFLVCLGIVARLAAVGNQIVIEREWVPLIAEQERNGANGNPTRKSTSVSMLSWVKSTLLSNSRPPLHVLNATTKRIDLIAKLTTPLVVSAAALDFVDIRWVAALLAVFQLVSGFAEVFLTKRVWLAFPSLGALKDREAAYHSIPTNDSGGEQTTSAVEGDSCPKSIVSRTCSGFLRSARLVRRYLAASVALPSIAFAIEPFSALEMAGTMSAYLLVANFSLESITIARTTSTMVEILSSVITPLLISWLHRRRLNKTHDQDDNGRMDSLITVGIIGLAWQVAALIPAAFILFFSVPVFQDPASSPALSAVLFASLALSRLGPFAYSLVEQQLVQLQLDEKERLEISGVETGLVDLAEMARWALVGIFGRPEEFRWVALAGFASVVTSLLLFTIWTQGRKR